MSEGVLAGLLMVSEGEVPGRPPGADLELTFAGGPQRAIKTVKFF
jgi:hypothetical protein